ncbi:MAG: hypothetical protein V1829_01720 [bacterium]
MIIPKIVIVKTIKGQKYADFISKQVNLAEYSCGITDIKGLKEYLNKNKCSPKTTIIHSRTAYPDYTYKVLKKLEQDGYKIINSAETIRLTSDKFNSCIYAIKKNIPCAETTKINKKEAVSFIQWKIKEWGRVVVKPITSQGQGEFCFKFDDSNVNQIKEIDKIPAKELVVQKFINYSRLNRVIVIGFKVLEKAVFWDVPDQGWKCSVCLNPKIKCYKKAPKDLLEFAEDVAKKFKAEISFIDIFSTEKGYVLNEINTACSLIIHEKISKYNISKKIADYLLSFV